MISKKAIAAVWVAALLAALVTATATVRPVKAGVRLVDANNGAANVDSKTLFAEKCSACHNLPNPTELAYTRPEWRQVVNKMLTKYGASDEISPSEADQIVDYLATFAPKQPAPDPQSSGRRLWAPEPDDVWAMIPTRSKMTNFEAEGCLSHLTPIAAGTHARPVWRLEAVSKTPDGTAARVSDAAAGPDAYALLIDPLDTGSDVDVRVRFKIVSGQSSPAVGIAVGLQDNRHYDLVRFNRKSNDLSLVQVTEPVHTTVQRTPMDLTAIDGGAVQATAFNGADGDWHTLRVQAHAGHIRAWVDSYKRINTTLDGYAGGKIALWSQGDTVAVFDDWSTDVYDPISGGTVHSTQ